MLSSKSTSIYSSVASTTDYASNSISNSNSITKSTGIKFYNDITEIPDYNLSFGNEQSDIQKNGMLWRAAPGTDQFGNIFICDGITLLVPVIFKSVDKDDLIWFRFCLNHNDNDFDTSVPVILPDETNNKIYTYAKNRTLYTESGESFAFEVCSYESIALE